MKNANSSACAQNIKRITIDFYSLAVAILKSVVLPLIVVIVHSITILVFQSTLFAIF